MIEQLEEEAPSARKMLERIPDDKLDWKPHEKSMTMAGLGGLVADMFGWFELWWARRNWISPKTTVTRTK